jgi:hypothetical protein
MQDLHDATPQKTAFFIFTAVKTSNLATFVIAYKYDFDVTLFHCVYSNSNWIGVELCIDTVFTVVVLIILIICEFYQTAVNCHVENVHAKAFV